jgi:hypothetical protein
MDLMFTCWHSGLTRWLLLVLTVYGLWCLITIVLRRSKRPGFLALVPLFVTMPVVWLEYANLLMAMAFSVGGGRPSLAVGFVQAMVVFGTGVCVTAALAIVALLRGPRQGTSVAASATGAVVAAALAGITLWFAAYALDGWPSHVPSMQLALAGSIGSAVAIVLYLLFAWRRQWYPSAVAVAITAVLVAIAARLQFEWLTVDG